MGEAARKLRAVETPANSQGVPPHLAAVDPALHSFVRALAAVIAADLKRNPPGGR